MTKEFWLCFTMTATQQTYSNPPDDYDNVDTIIHEFNKVQKVDWRADKKQGWVVGVTRKGALTENVPNKSLI